MTRSLSTFLKSFGLGLLAASVLAAQPVVTMWVHSGPGPEAKAYWDAVDAFNEQNPDIRLELVKLPEGGYSDQVEAAARGHRLPDLLDFDGPNVYNYAWAKRIIPLDDFPVLTEVKKDLLPSLVRQGTFQGRLYSLGQYDSGLAIWGNRRLLEKAGVRIPAKPRQAWKRSEFEAVLKRLKESGVPTPLDMKFNYGIGEWLTFGFSPIVQSFGGDLVDRDGFRTARGVINGPGAVEALTMLQGWARKGYVDPAAKDDRDFIDGRSALSYVGHWVYADYKKALGDDLVLIPMPRFGSRAVTGAGSWNFGISAESQHPEAAARVLAFLMSTPEILRVTGVNGAMPGTNAALEASEAYGRKGALRLYVQQARKRISRVRPETPAYPVITRAFAEAVQRIMTGSDVREALDRAADTIDRALGDFAAESRP